MVRISKEEIKAFLQSGILFIGLILFYYASDIAVTAQVSPLLLKIFILFMVCACLLFLAHKKDDIQQIG